MIYTRSLPKKLTLLFFSILTSHFFAQKIDLAPKSFYDSIQAKQIQLLDVRTSGEYNQGHIADAFQADWNDFEQFKYRTASLDKHQPLYLYCLAGSRSAAAQNWLIKEGFETVINLRGGINSWNLEDLPLEGKKEVKQLSMTEFLASLPPNKTVLVDIGAEWCPPCKAMDPILEELSEELAGRVKIVKLDVEENPATVVRYNVRAMPTMIVFKDGVPADMKIGAGQSRVQLVKWLDQFAA